MSNPENSEDQTFEISGERDNSQSDFVRFIMVLFGLAYDAQPIEIESSKQPDEIIAALKAKVDSSWFGGYFSFKGRYKGRVKDNSFSIWWYSGQRNSWAPYLYGTVESAVNGSKVRAHFDIHPAVKIFTIVWICPLLYLAMQGVFLSGSDKMFSLFPLGMILFMLIVIKVGAIMGKSDHKKLLELLEQVSKP